MSKLTAHDFAQVLQGGVAYSGRIEDILDGLEKLRRLIRDGQVQVQSVTVTSALQVEEFVRTELVLKLIEKV